MMVLQNLRREEIAVVDADVAVDTHLELVAFGFPVVNVAPSRTAKVVTLAGNSDFSLHSVLVGLRGVADAV